MATQKKETKTKQEVKQEIKQYKVVGKTFESKSVAVAELEEAFKKGFKRAGLMVQGNEFVILYGTYTTEQIAEKSAAIINKAGLTATVV